MSETILSKIEVSSRTGCDVKNSEMGQKHKRTKQHTPFQQGLSCPECGKTSSDKSNLAKHIKSQHQGIVYPCNECEYKAKQTTHLKVHIKNKHSQETKLKRKLKEAATFL